MMLYTPWKSEKDLKVGLDGEKFSTHQQAYDTWKLKIEPILSRKKCLKAIARRSLKGKICLEF